MKMTIIIVVAWFIIANLFNQGHGAVIEKEKSIFNFTGQCEKGKVYTIKDEKDLREDTLRPELECVYQAGLVPSGVMTGKLVGHFVAVLNTGDPVTGVLDLGWDGKTIEEVTCEQGQGEAKTIYFGWNTVLSSTSIGPFIARIDEMRDEEMEPGEYLDHRPSLFLDYTVNFLTGTDTEGCNLVALLLSQGRIVPPFNHYPLSDGIDTLRLVGRQADNGNIYLGKGYIKNPLSQKFRTKLYFSVVNYDDDLGGGGQDDSSTGIEIGESLPPLPNTFQFSIEGL